MTNLTSIKQSREKRDFILRWLEEEGDLTTYCMFPKVVEYGDKFYPYHKYGIKCEKMAQANLVYHFNKLVKEGLVEPCVRWGLGEGSRNNNWGCRTQSIWSAVKNNQPQQTGE